MPDPLWRNKVGHTRKEAMRTIRNIRAGDVNEIDLDMLQNFVQFSLALMLMEGEKKWARAKLNAELMNYMKEGEE
jgi:hypothetical protein